MSKVKINLKWMLSMAVVLFFAVSCKKPYDIPPITELPVGEVLTIGEIIEMESGVVFNDDASVYGIVTADEVSGNLYKAAYIQDRLSGKAISLRLDAASGLRAGDSIRIYLKGVTYMTYNNLPQLSGFGPDGHIVILANKKFIEPASVSIADVKSGNYLAQLVKIENVTFLERTTFAAPDGYGERTLSDVNDPSQTIMVRTSNYANFANDSLPAGTGSLTAIASLYGSTWQMIIPSIADVDFDGIGGGGGGGVAGEVQSLPYYQSFGTQFGTYTTYDVAGAEQWEIDFNTAKMTGYSNSTNNANEDWLISSPVALTGITDAKMSMTYIARYFNDLNNDITVQVSTDYVYGTDPTAATWTPVASSWVSGSNWTDFSTTELSLTPFVGQTVTVAVKYLSTEAKAGTIEVQSITIEEGTANGGGGGGGVTGEVQSLPYTQSFTTQFGTYSTYDVAGAQQWEIDFSTAKMTGYVSGTNYANEDWLISSPVALTGVTDAKMSMTYIARYFSDLNNDITVQVSTNYVAGSNPTAATWTPVAAAWILGSNWNDFATTELSLTPFVGQTVTVAVRYLSTDVKAGTIEVQSITIEEGSANGGGGGGGDEPGEVQTLPYTQSFATQFGTYSTYDVSGTQQWEIDFSTAKMTGYVSGTNYANEDWLISSPVALTGVTDAKMSMTYIARYFDNVDSDITVQVSTNYVAGSNPTAATWTPVAAAWILGSNWNDFATTELSLTPFVGQTVTVAVRYLSTDVKAGTIEVQSITIEEGSANGGGGGGGNGNGGTEDDPYTVAEGIELQAQQPVAWVRGYIVGCVKSGISTVASNDNISWEAPFELATNVVIADSPDERDIANCIIVNLPSGKPLREQVNLIDHPENLGLTLSVTGKLRTYFGQAGLRDSSGSEGTFHLGTK